MHIASSTYPTSLYTNQEKSLDRGKCGIVVDIVAVPIGVFRPRPIFLHQ